MKPAIASTCTPVTAISGAYTTSSAAHTSVPLDVLGQAGDVREQPADVVVDPDGVGLERRGEPPVADDKGVAHHGASEVAGPQPVDRIGVPDAPDVEAVASHRGSVPRGTPDSSPSTTTLEAEVPGGVSKERPPPSKRKPLRGTRAPPRRLGIHAELLADRGIVEQTLASYQWLSSPVSTPFLIRSVRPVGSPSHVMPLEPSEPRRGAVVVDAEPRAQATACRACPGTACSTSRRRRPGRRGRRGCS